MSVIRTETIGDCTLYLGDCRDVLPTLGRVDVTITSPPYNMGLSPGGNGRGLYRVGIRAKANRFRNGYGICDDAMEPAAYEAWQRWVLAEVYRLSRVGVFYNHRPRIEHGTFRPPLSFDYGDVPLRQVIIWDRGTGIDVSLRQFCTHQEWIMIFAGDGFRLRSHAASGLGDVWSINPAADRPDHPAPFPVALPARVLQAVEAKSVLDPFMGSGSTGVAAVRAAAAFVGIEVEPKHFDTACRRIAEAYRQPRLFSEPAPKPVQTALFDGDAA